MINHYDIDSVLKLLSYMLSPQEYADRIRPLVTDTIYLINDVISEGKNVLIEGANAVMLDFDLGEYGCCGTFN